MAEFQEVMKQKDRMCKCKRPSCSQCGLYSKNNKAGCNCDYFIVRNYEQAEEIIMKWVEEHPVQTNADKFKEVFGNLVFDCVYEQDADKEWWEQEYKEPKE